MGALWGHFGVILVPLLGTLWGHLLPLLGTLWGHLGVIFVPLLGTRTVLLQLRLVPLQHCQSRRQR